MLGIEIMLGIQTILEFGTIGTMLGTLIMLVFSEIPKIKKVVENLRQTKIQKETFPKFPLKEI